MNVMLTLMIPACLRWAFVLALMLPPARALFARLLDEHNVLLVRTRPEFYEQLARAQLKVMIVISARPFEEYFETVPNVSARGRLLSTT